MLITCLTSTAMDLSKHLSLQLSTMTAEIFSNERCPFSLTMEISEEKVVRRIYSNFNDTVRVVMTGFDRISGVFGVARRRTEVRTYGPDRS